MRISLLLVLYLVMPHVFAEVVVSVKCQEQLSTVRRLGFDFQRYTWLKLKWLKTEETSTRNSFDAKLKPSDKRAYEVAMLSRVSDRVRISLTPAYAANPNFAAVYDVLLERVPPDSRFTAQPLEVTAASVAGVKLYVHRDGRLEFYPDPRVRIDYTFKAERGVTRIGSLTAEFRAAFESTPARPTIEIP